jgi:hypothetical protein
MPHINGAKALPRCVLMVSAGRTPSAGAGCRRLARTPAAVGLSPSGQRWDTRRWRGWSVWRALSCRDDEAAAAAAVPRWRLLVGLFREMPVMTNRQWRPVPPHLLFLRRFRSPGWLADDDALPRVPRCPLLAPRNHCMGRDDPPTPMLEPPLPSGR